MNKPTIRSFTGSIRSRSSLAVLLILLALIACTFSYRTVGEFDPPKSFRSSQIPIKAHLIDGSLIVFEQGTIYLDGMLAGRGVRFDLHRNRQGQVDHILLDSVACLEYYKNDIQTGPLIGELIASAVFIGAVSSSAEIAKAIFGSCPTVYTRDGEKYSLQAECFSYSISPLLEAADLDRLDSGRPRDGIYSLKLTNEALETHYINSMRLLYVDHPPGSEALPDVNERILLFGPARDLLSVQDRSGQDILSLVRDRDECVYRTDRQTVQEFTDRVVRDWIEVQVDVPDKARRMVVGLRLRNTLFSTVLTYDVMLRSKGWGALDWIGHDMNRLGPAWRLWKWYWKNFGMQVLVWNGKKYETKAYIEDTGPIAWRQMAVEIPISRKGPARFRLSFLPDNWMIDWIGVSFDPPKEMKVHEVACSGIECLVVPGRDLPADLIRDRDRRYMVTGPAEAYLLSFKVGDGPGSGQRTYFLKSSGFYIEWIRSSWLVADRGESDLQFELNDGTLTRTARLWLSKKDDFEREFFNSRISGAAGSAP